MTKFTESSYVERIVIALNEDGTFRGASQERHNLTFKDDVEIGRERFVEPVEPDAIASLLPKHADTIAQVSSLVTERDTLADAIDAHKAEAREAVAAAETAAAELAIEQQAHQATRDRHKRELHAASSATPRRRADHSTKA